MQTSDSNSFEKLSSSQDPNMWTNAEMGSWSLDPSLAEQQPKLELRCLPLRIPGGRQQLLHSLLHGENGHVPGWLFPALEQQLSPIITSLQTTFRTYGHVFILVAMRVCFKSVFCSLVYIRKKRPNHFIALEILKNFYLWCLWYSEVVWQNWQVNETILQFWIFLIVL